MEGNNPRNLEGWHKNEERKFVPRKFFWDIIALYIISVIMDIYVLKLGVDIILSQVHCMKFELSTMSVLGQHSCRVLCNYRISHDQPL